MPLSHDEFVSLLTASQRRVYAFICTLVVDRSDADEVLQETNLALWQQIERFEPGTDFVAWACRVAHFKVMKLRDAAKRHRVKLDDAVIELLATESIEEQRADHRLAAERYERNRLALVACLEELSERNRNILLLHYQGGQSLATIGTSIGRTANAVAQLFHRIRALLRTCVQRRLADTPA
ncbi:MAG: sigma-70 family RNA polymerase sigma factor [Planctomycetia bacterium]|jgi:RNA polymerase sigma-70 factor (ECF subfamily)|nr:sigma-70 family RNA polymerase sigma factor [Planctomycetia bacterium]